MRKVRLINQIDDSSCVYACVAMACNVSLKEVFEYSGKDERGMDHHDELRAIKHFGYNYTHLIEPHIPCYGVFIITVPSLNIEGGLHRIVVRWARGEGWDVYDPQNGRPEKLYYTKDNLSAWSELLLVGSGFDEQEE